MKNKIKLKRFLIIFSFISICLLSLFLAINIHEYHVYTDNFNKKLNSIIVMVKEKYPTVTEKDLLDIINSNNSDVDDIFERYGIYVEKESIIPENTLKYHKYLIINNIFFICTIVILLCVFLKYESNKNKDIKEITKYIEEINKKNYSLHIDEISEDELSILKNEIYKTTIMLKESANNSLKDKKELKKSLEDISHQIKTPLTSILIILDNIIYDSDMDKEVREDFIRDIKREVSNINFLIQTILKLSKFDADTISYIEKYRYIKDIVKESVKNVSMLCDLKNVRIKTSGNDKAKIKCDFMWQVEAITNIIKNCVEHSKEDDEIIISYEQNNVYSSIVIKDNGEGIDKKDLPYIFERFYKGKNSSLDSIGIGLSLSKTIIEKSNGQISVDSDNSGTKFTIKYFNL